jgi:hypothetical protein
MARDERNFVAAVIILGAVTAALVIWDYLF